MQLPNTPPKWTSDWFPEEYKLRKYIFDTWRQVCLRYGFQEYLGPLVEPIDIWKAKSWEDVGWSELTQITNREWHLDGLAIRPEMTPTVTRMVSRKWKECDKPLKWFSIANFYRNEKPQKWRNREFWQLNADIFGESWVNADREILTLALELMRAFDAPSGSYMLKLNHRWLIESFFQNILKISDETLSKKLMRLLDKYEKMTWEAFTQWLWELWLGDISSSIEKFMSSQSISDLAESFPDIVTTQSFQDFSEISTFLVDLWYASEIQFSGDLIRGFDYYDGIIFEMFDQNSDNPRALFWGGRYNGLASIFWVKEDIPAVGFAPGDETMKLFLEGHNLLKKLVDTQEEKYYFPLLEGVLFSDVQSLASCLRQQWKNIELWLSKKKLAKAMKYADKHHFSHVVIFGEEECQKSCYKIKHLQSGDEKICLV